jgi:hypothetical protein
VTALPLDSAAVPVGADARLRWRLVTLSFSMLFVELALIRWTAAYDIHLTYLTNFVLLASFLGIGLGFLRADRGPDLFAWAPVPLLLLVAFVFFFPVGLPALDTPTRLEGSFGMSALPIWLVLSVVFLLVVATMAAIAHGVAATFGRFAPLEAYRLDIAGSIAGTVAFSCLAFLGLPPVAWGAVAAVLLAALSPRRIQLVALIPVIVLLAIQSAAAHDSWSPYYKITAVRVPARRIANIPVRGALAISANNVPHQTAYAVATLRRLEPFYFYPYRYVDRKRLRDVLIVGAGNGNDVAVALSEGAKHIDAVEIDPTIQSLGARYHPSRPYQNPRVSVHIDDGRAYIQRTSRHYDLILFALPDSLTLFAGQGTLRLENYLFTTESMTRVRSLLRSGGTFAMYNYYEHWLLNRYASTLRNVYGRPPCVAVGQPLGGRRQAVLTEASSGAGRCATWHGAAVEAPTDDHPFPYLQHRAIPAFYLKVLGLMLLASLVLIPLAGARYGRMAGFADLALMGGAFLLLETKNVVQFALFFGTTWFVNALVFAGVLLSVYAAVETARLARLPSRRVLYALLFGSLAVAWAVPPASLLALSPVPRFFAAVTIAFMPIFLANLVFAQRFRETAAIATAFGANLLGAMIGGLLEYLALITGYRALLLVVAGLYALAFLASGFQRRGALRAPAP